MAASNHKIYDNFLLENEISDQFDTAIDLQNFFEVDNDLEGVPGMVKKINRYKATDSTEELAMGQGNSKSIEVSFDTFEYRVKLAQNQFDYYDEQEMTDPMIVQTGIRRMSSGMFNKVNADFMGELKKLSTIYTATEWDIDLFADAVGGINIEGTDNDPEKDIEAFAFLNPKDVAKIRKLAKETLQYNESFARQGYVGTLYGVNLYTKKDQTEGETEVAVRQAVKLFNKKGVTVEQDRNASPADVGNARHNYMWSNKYYLVALVDDTKGARIIIDSTVVTPSVTLSDSTATVAAGETETLTATTVPADVTVTWTSSDETAATVADGVVTGVAAGSATITAKITVNGVDYTDTCAVTVTAAG
jgi:hypothetical protein